MAFLLLGIISLSIGLANFACASEPRSFDRKLPSGLPTKKGAETSTWAKFKATLWDIKSVVTVPTFAIIIVQVPPVLLSLALLLTVERLHLDPTAMWQCSHHRIGS